MNPHRLRVLLNQYFDNSISKADCKELLDYLDEVDNVVVNKIIDEQVLQQDQKVSFREAQKLRVYNKLLNDIQFNQPLLKNKEKSTSFSTYRRWTLVAATLLIGLTISLLIYRKDSTSIERIRLADTSHDILLPDENQAVLKLTNGNVIILSDSMDGVIAQQAGVYIRKEGDGGILYDTRFTSSEEGVGKYNTLSTPKGQTYRLLLPDGTKVWLNTASSIQFPISFSGGKRVVNLSGEAYFEVAHNPNVPFHVHANGSVIKVLGTHFNVSAYDDEKVTTTLLEGSVDVWKNDENVILYPGQQAVVDLVSEKVYQYKADIRYVMAWKNGYFRFQDDDIESILNKISKWYNIDSIEYQGKFDDKFTGTFQRFKGLSQLLNHLEKIAHIQFKVEGRRVTVMQ